MESRRVLSNDDTDNSPAGRCEGRERWLDTSPKVTPVFAKAARHKDRVGSRSTSTRDQTALHEEHVTGASLSLPLCLASSADVRRSLPKDSYQALVHRRHPENCSESQATVVAIQAGAFTLYSSGRTRKAHLERFQEMVARALFAAGCPSIPPPAQDSASRARARYAGVSCAQRVAHLHPGEFWLAVSMFDTKV